MHRKPVFAANWKMNHGPSDARAFMNRFLALAPRMQDRTIIFFPSALTLATVADSLKDRQDMLLGVQNVHEEPQGAFTGENSVLMARDAGARVVLCGHSERRHVFGESDEVVGKKCTLVAQSRLIPMLCVGETLEERESGATASIVEGQLAAGIAGLDDQQVATMMLAYEPVWAIGTGRTAMPADASEIHGVLRRALSARLGDRPAAAIPILYGGSVNRGNAATLIATPEVDGLLVGGASLDADSWSSITRS
jgi:triosephosphate isomerase (TIM)